MIQKIVSTILILFIYSSFQAQYAIKIKKEDNRFLFFQLGQKSDIIIKNKTDLFFIKLPDSLAYQIEIHINNGQFTQTTSTNVYRLIPIIGMKYSHTQQDTVLNTLLEGSCTSSKSINIKLINKIKNQLILKNDFLVK